MTSWFRVGYAGIVHSVENRVLELSVTNNGYPRLLCWADLISTVKQKLRTDGVVKNRI